MSAAGLATRGNEENELGLESGDHIKVPATVQKRHASKDGVRGEQAARKGEKVVTLAGR